MRNLYTLIICLSTLISFGQEFQVYDNGLIYSPAAMHKLGTIVGGKNNEFRECELNKEFMSVLQTKGAFFKIKTRKRSALKRELEGNISLEDFIERYTHEKDVKLKLITRQFYVDRENDSIFRLKERPDGNSLDILVKDWNGMSSKDWVFDFSNKKYVEVVYLVDEFRSKPIPYKYARMIQYSECLIDTTQQVFKDTANRTGVYYGRQGSTIKRERFLKHIDNSFSIKRPRIDFEKDDSQEYFQKMHDSINEWEISKKNYVANVLSFQEDFCKLLHEAYLEAVEHKNSTDEFEGYVAAHLSKSKALELKRNRRVIGGCSMDMSPRIHAMNIAQLSAESYSWDIFLRSHLNIMNDRFDRVSDGSWAWAARKTYIKELEELDINVPDLIIGISFRVQNPAQGHYYGSIGRTGRAIAESSEIEKFEKELREIISNEEVDDYNRLLTFYLFQSMAYHKDSTKEKKDYKRMVTEAIELLPGYLRPNDI